MKFYCRMDAAGSLQECFSQCSECAAARRYTRKQIEEIKTEGVQPADLTLEELHILCDMAIREASRPEDATKNREAVIEECARIVDRKGQDLTDEYCHGDAGPDGYTWTNKEAEWQVILLSELADEFRALKNAAPQASANLSEDRREDGPDTDVTRGDAKPGHAGACGAALNTSRSPLVTNEGGMMARRYDVMDRGIARYTLRDMEIFCARAAQASVEAALQAIDDEPEVPGRMPDEMWDALRGDRDACENAIRIAVRQTKEGIRKRLLAHEPQSPGSAERKA